MRGLEFQNKIIELEQLIKSVKYIIDKGRYHDMLDDLFVLQTICTDKHIWLIDSMIREINDIHANHFPLTYKQQIDLENDYR